MQGTGTLRRVTIGPKKSGANGSHSFHGYGEGTTLKQLTAVDVTDNSSSTFLVGGTKVRTDLVDITRMRKTSGMTQIGYRSTTQNGTLKIKDSQFDRLSIDGGHWERVEISGTTWNSFEHAGDTFASGNRTWDFVDNVVINGQVVKGVASSSSSPSASTSTNKSTKPKTTTTTPAAPADTPPPDAQPTTEEAMLLATEAAEAIAVQEAVDSVKAGEKSNIPRFLDVATFVLGVFSGLMMHQLPVAPVAGLLIQQ
jgi:hypothetical protein